MLVGFLGDFYRTGFTIALLQALGFTMFNPTYGLDRERLWSCGAAVGQSGLCPAYHLVGTGIFCG